MLNKYHSELKNIILVFFKLWRLDFLPGSNWRIISTIKLSVYPALLVSGWFFAYWHFFYQMKGYDDVLDFAFTTIFVIVYYQVLMVYLSIHVLNKDGVIKVLEYFDELVSMKDTEVSEIRRKIFTKVLKNATIFAKLFITGLGSVGVIVNCYDLNKTGFTSPMLFLIPGIPENSIFFYPVNIIYQVILYFSTMGLIIVSDAVIMVIIMYFQAELSVITEQIRQLEDDSIVAKKANIIIKTVHEEHKVFLDMFKDISYSLWHTYFYKLLTIMMYLCFTLFVFRTINGNLIVGLLCAIAMVWEVFILCYFGQMVRNSSEIASDALYMSKWYIMRVSDQKDLLMLMMRFKYPIKVETFGFGTISIYTFVQICKAAVSYVAILYTFFD